MVETGFWSIILAFLVALPLSDCSVNHYPEINYTLLLYDTFLAEVVAFVMAWDVMWVISCSLCLLDYVNVYLVLLRQDRSCMYTLKDYIVISCFLFYNDLCLQSVAKLIDAIRTVSLPTLVVFDEKLLIHFTTEDKTP